MYTHHVLQDHMVRHPREGAGNIILILDFLGKGKMRECKTERGDPLLRGRDQLSSIKERQPFLLYVLASLIHLS
jgi:hypothetical protein